MKNNTSSQKISDLPTGVPPPLKILVIEDDEDDFFIIRELIRGISGSNFIIDWCYHYEEAVKLVCTEEYALVFVDYLLGEKTGIELLRHLRQIQCEEPIIILTGIGNHQIDVEAMKHGAADYLVKAELTTENLERCIRYNLQRSEDRKVIKSNERKFHSIFEKSKDPIFLADETLCFLEVNAAATELFSYSRHELLHLTFYDLLGDPHVQDDLKKKWKENHKIENFEAILLTQSGERKNCIFSFSKEINSTGETYVQGIIRDKTLVKKMEKANLLIEKLRSTEKLLRILAHEVRNPLTNISLAAEQLKTESSAAEFPFFIDIIIRNHHRIDILISELLDSARPGELALARTSLQHILGDALNAVNDRIVLNNLKLEVFKPEEVFYIVADTEKLKIAILNILLNAIEAVSPGEGILSVKLEQKDQNVKMFISDNGPGISAENLTKIYEPYFTSKKNGFGLGLASTLNILETHGASIEVESELGAGACFIMTFKLA